MAPVSAHTSPLTPGPFKVLLLLALGMTFTPNTGMQPEKTQICNTLDHAVVAAGNKYTFRNVSQ